MTKTTTMTSRKNDRSSSGKKRQRRGRGEGSVFYSESKGAWIGRVIIGTKPDGSPQRSEVRGATKADVLSRMREEQQQQTDKEKKKKPAKHKADEWTVSAWIRHYLDDVARQSVEPSTWELYDRVFTLHIQPHMGKLLLSQVTSQIVADALDAAQKINNMKRNSLQSSYTVLSTAFTHAVDRGLLASSPMLSLPKRSRRRYQKCEATEITVFSVDECRRIRERCEHWIATDSRKRQTAPMFLLALATGCRRGELFALTWPCVSVDESPSIRIERSAAFLSDRRGPLIKRPKSKRGYRTIPLPAFAAQALAAHRQRQEKEFPANWKDLPVFCTSKGTHLNCKIYQDHWTRLLSDLAIPHRKFHTLRHTHASQLLSQGVPVTEVARRLGDHPRTILSTYAHYLPSTGDVAGTIDRLIG